MSAAHDQPRDPRLTSKIFAVVEPLFLIGALAVAASQLAPLLGLPTRDERNAFLYEAATPQWIDASITEATWLCFRYGLTLLIVWAVCVWRRGPTRREAALSTGGHSPLKLIGIGLAACLIVLAPHRVVMAIHAVHPLGANTPFWDLMARTEWTPDFWIYMAVSSFVLVPIIEELYFRAYTLGRHRESFSTGGALILGAVFFWVAHGQYIVADPYLAFNSAYVFVGTLMLGYITVRTGSIIPALAAHMLLNVPASLPFLIAWVVAGVVLLFALRKTVGAYLRDFLALIAATREWMFLIGAAVAIAGLVTAVRMQPQLLLPAAGLLGLVFLAGLFRRRPRG